MYKFTCAVLKSLSHDVLKGLLMEICMGPEQILNDILSMHA